MCAAGLGGAREDRTDFPFGTRINDHRHPAGTQIGGTGEDLSPVARFAGSPVHLKFVAYPMRTPLDAPVRDDVPLQEVHQHAFVGVRLDGQPHGIRRLARTGSAQYVHRIFCCKRGATAFDADVTAAEIDRFRRSRDNGRNSSALRARSRNWGQPLTPRRKSPRKTAASFFPITSTFLRLAQWGGS